MNATGASGNQTKEVSAKIAVVTTRILGIGKVIQNAPNHTVTVTSVNCIDKWPNPMAAILMTLSTNAPLHTATGDTTVFRLSDQRLAKDRSATGATARGASAARKNCAYRTESAATRTSLIPPNASKDRVAARVAVKTSNS